METIQNLLHYNWFVVASALIAAMLAFKFLSDLFEWFVKKFGIETRSMRERREGKELLKNTAQNLTELQKKHNQDEKSLRDDLKELTNSVKAITKGQDERDEQIAALMEGSKELLGDTIDQRYDKYISLGGIPQNEVDEFDAIYNAYTGLKGNHGRETKYKYVKEHLPVLPVKTEIITDK